MMAPATDHDLLGHHSMGPGPAATQSMVLFDAAPQQHQLQAQQQQPPPEDLLGFTASSQQYQQQAINANENQATNAGIAAPTIAGIGRIAPSAQNNEIVQNKPKRKAIKVPSYSCNGGLDWKFNHYARHARPSHLHNLLTPTEYEREITTLNDKIKKARPNSVDYALLATGPLMVPLALWGARHGKQVKRKRTLIEEGVWEFNERMGMDGRNVRMVWNRAKVVGGGESFLTIEEVEESGDGKDSKKFD
mmetsp:Transcript_41029/g.86070  ORF Transcript_41029/g.86070 Transcript_41029/m.86070 type:complete len:248 (+) Transcript_41029:53-796(+)